MNSLDWDLVRVFVTVAREGSLSRAALLLRSSQPTVGRQVAALEEQLGTALVVRSPRGVVLTDAGRTLREASDGVVDGMTELVRRVRGDTDVVRGTVRITAPEPMAVYLLPSFLAPLRKIYPELQLELVADNRPIDLLAGEADVAVRLFQPEQLDLVRRHLGSAGSGLFASQGYLERRGEPESFEDLLAGDHDVLGFDANHWAAAAYRSVDPRLVRNRFSVRSDSICVQLEAARAGLGVVPIQVGIARLLPGLVRVLPDVALPPSDVWLAMHRDVRASVPVRRVFDTLASGLAEYVSANG